ATVASLHAVADVAVVALLRDLARRATVDRRASAGARGSARARARAARRAAARCIGGSATVARRARAVDELSLFPAARKLRHRDGGQDQDQAGAGETKLHGDLSFDGWALNDKIVWCSARRRADS